MTTTTCAYPSRVDATPEILPRQEPVVYGDMMAKDGKPLSLRELEQFDRRGFLFLPEVFTRDEIDLMNKELNILARRPNNRKRPEVIQEPSSRTVRSIFEVHKSSPTFRRAAADRRLAGIAEQILDSRAYIHQSRVNLKPALDGKEFFWHSDFETWHQEDGMPAMRAVSMSIFLTDSVEFNGPLMVVPRSHRQFVQCAGETPDEHYKQSLRRQQYGVPDLEGLTQLVENNGIEAPKGPAGSVVIFDCNLMHGSTGNLSPWPRVNLFFVYNSVKNALVDPFCGQPPRPEYIASRNWEAL